MPYKSKEAQKKAMRELMRKKRGFKGIINVIPEDVIPKKSVIPDVTPCLKCSELKIEILGLQNRISDLVKERGSFVCEIESLKERIKSLMGSKGFMSGKRKDVESDDLPFSKKRQSGGKMST